MARWLIVVALLVAGGAYWWLRDATPDDAVPTYVTAVADRGSITAVVTATGVANPVNSVQVGTYVSGPIAAILVDFNSTIRKGQRLAKIDPQSFQMKVDAATADLANARAQATKARADARLKATTLGRQRTLARQGIAARSELDVAESEARQAAAQVAVADAAVQSAEARRREAEVNLAYTDIVAPIDGVVVARNVSPGQTVAASFQTPVLFVVAEDLTKMQVAASVSESDIGGVAVGQTASFAVDAFPGATFQGTVSQVRNSPVSVQNVVTYDVIIAVDNADLRLRPGMTANVTIVTARRDDVVRVPARALRFKPPASVTTAATVATSPRVWKLGPDGTPTPADVRTGIADEEHVEITAGLAPGDAVITGIAPVGSGPAPGRGPGFAAGGTRRGH